jgi:Fe-S cluster biogenesis protein NfuA
MGRSSTREGHGVQEASEANVRDFIETFVRPKTRVDGGDLRFAALEGDTVVLTAYADCATCPSVGDCLPAWIEKQLAARFGRPLRVRINREPPYFAR